MGEEEILLFVIYQDIPDTFNHDVRVVILLSVDMTLNITHVSVRVPHITPLKMANAVQHVPLM